MTSFSFRSNPRRETPRSANAILNRLNEISFNALLMKERRTIALLRQAADPGTGEGRRWAEMRTYLILTDKLAEFGASSKLNAEGAFLQLLKDEGRKTAEKFLTAHGEDIGKRSTADLDVLLAEC
jgi:NTE family protein